MSWRWLTSDSLPPYTENTPLIRRRDRRQCMKVVLLILPVILLFVLFTIWGPYIMSGVAIERLKWNQELRRRLAAEQSRIKQERLREDQWHREEEERQRLGLHWDLPIADSHCTAYNTREYWARLLNTVPFEYNWLRPCEDMPIIIYGRSIKTTRCYVNPDVPGEVYGHWLVDFNEPSCSPYWDQVKDKGCTADGSGWRRVEAHLENIHGGEDGEKLCASVPFDIYGRHFDHPDSCANWGDNGIFGMWEIDDPNC